MDNELKRAIILDHYQNPHNKGLIDDPSYKKVHMASDSCIDDITVAMKIIDDQVADVRFDGVGCTIATSSTSIMSELIKGKSTDEALKLIDEYYAMIDDKPFDAELLEEANAFDTLCQQANRIKCGTIGIKAMNMLLREYKNEE